MATHATCPVAVIRGIPDRDINGHPRPVVVGVDGTQHSEPAISMAFEEAAQRQSELVAVHAWSDIVLELSLDGGTDAEWERDAANETALLSENLAGYADNFPDVKVRTIVVRDRPSDTCVSKPNTRNFSLSGVEGEGDFPVCCLGRPVGR